MCSDIDISDAWLTSALSSCLRRIRKDHDHLFFPELHSAHCVSALMHLCISMQSPAGVDMTLRNAHFGAS